MNRTKDAIAAAFFGLLTERPLSKITVKDIVDRCGINRNTFYYHFEGIPSLLEQTVKYMSDQIIQTHSKFGSPIDCIAPFVPYCTDNKKPFYIFIVLFSGKCSCSIWIERRCIQSVNMSKLPPQVCLPQNAKQKREIFWSDTINAHLWVLFWTGWIPGWNTICWRQPRIFANCSPVPGNRHS